MTADPRPGEPRSVSEVHQLASGESPADCPGVAGVEQRVGRQASERADGEIRQPVPFNIADDDGGGGETAPRREQTLGLAGVEVVEQHRRDDVVERLFAERQLAGVGADDLDVRPAPARRAGQIGDDGIGVHGDDMHPYGGGAGAHGERARDVPASTADVKDTNRCAPPRLEHPAEWRQDAAGAAEAAIGDTEVRQGPNSSTAGASERVRLVSRLKADHGPTSMWPGYRPHLTRPVQIIISARAGRGAGGDIGARLAHALRCRGHSVHVHRVDDLRRARAQLVGHARSLTCLIGIGGDHTLSELGRVACEACVPLLPVPAGFGNIFAAELGWRATVPAVIETLECGRVELVDAGLFGNSLFLANQGFGFLELTKLAVETSGHQPRQRWRRYGSYVQAALRSILHAPLPRLAVDVDGHRVADRAPLAIVANVPTYRTFMPLVMDASPFDALLDVVVAPAMSKTTLVAWLLRVLVRAPGGAVRRRATRVGITDGTTKHDVVVVPSSVPVLLPPSRRAHRTGPKGILASTVGRRQYDQSPDGSSTSHHPKRRAGRP